MNLALLFTLASKAERASASGTSPIAVPSTGWFRVARWAPSPGMGGCRALGWFGQFLVWRSCCHPRCRDRGGRRSTEVQLGKGDPRQEFCLPAQGPRVELGSCAWYRFSRLSCFRSEKRFHSRTRTWERAEVSAWIRAGWKEHWSCVAFVLGDSVAARLRAGGETAASKREQTSFNPL